MNGILVNHESPRRGENFVTRKITRAVSEIAAGNRDHVTLGNLDAKRDWGFAADFVEAMWLMLQGESPQDYVVGTGETHSVREFAEMAFAEAGVQIQWHGSGIDEIGVDPAAGETRVRIDPRYFRPAEVDLLLADPALIKRNLGWKPRTTFGGLVQLMMSADLVALGIDPANE